MPLFYNSLSRPADSRGKKSSQPCEAFERNEWIVSNDHRYAGSAIEHPAGNVHTPHSAPNHTFHSQARFRTSLNRLHQLNPLAHPRVQTIVNNELGILLSLLLPCTTSSACIRGSTAWCRPTVSSKLRRRCWR